MENKTFLLNLSELPAYPLKLSILKPYVPKSLWHSELKVEKPGVLDALDEWLEKTGYSTVSEEIQQAEELVAQEEKNERKVGKIDTRT